MVFPFALQVCNPYSLMFINNKFIQIYSTLWGAHKFLVFSAMEQLRAVILAFFTIHYTILGLMESTYLRRTKKS
jgi:hypothetical protein